MYDSGMRGQLRALAARRAWRIGFAWSTRCIPASVYISDAESGLIQDYDDWLEKLAPQAPTSQYHHNRTGEDNAAAHLKRQINGPKAGEFFVAIRSNTNQLPRLARCYRSEARRNGRRRRRVTAAQVNMRPAAAAGSGTAAMRM